MPVALAVLAGLALLATGLPRAGAGLAAVPALEAVQPGAAGWLDESRLHAALAGLAEAVAAQPTADDHARLAYLSGVVAGRAADAATRAARLADGRRHAEAGVLAGAADPYHWLMLADAEVRRAGVGAAAVGAIAMSFATAPESRVLLLPRLDLALLAWPRLDEAQRRLVGRSIRLAASSRDLAGLVRLTRRRHALAAVRAALGPVPATAAAFDRAYLAALSDA